MDWVWTEGDIAVWKLESFNDVINEHLEQYWQHTSLIQLGLSQVIALLRVRQVGVEDIDDLSPNGAQ